MHCQSYTVDCETQNLGIVLHGFSGDWRESSQSAESCRLITTR